jgi:hypothetical protein
VPRVGTGAVRSETVHASKQERPALVTPTRRFRATSCLMYATCHVRGQGVRSKSTETPYSAPLHDFYVKNIYVYTQNSVV